MRATRTSLSWNVGFSVGGMMPTFVALASQTTERSPQTVVTFLLAAIVPDVIGAIVVPEKGI
jgi:MHS family proline/betaine transporter-like MFS transporter